MASPPSQGPSAAPTLNAAVANAPPSLGGPAYRTWEISADPTANASVPCTSASTTVATGLPAVSANRAQPTGSAVPPVTSSSPGRASATRPDTVTPRNEPTPNSASTIGTHAASSPATPVTTGARYVYAQKVAPLTSAPSSSVTSSRRSRRLASSPRTDPAGAPSRETGAAFRIARNAGADTRATAQNADRQPHISPSTAPAGTPATQAAVTPPSRTDVARAFLSGATIAAAADSATARKPAFAT